MTVSAKELATIDDRLLSPREVVKIAAWLDEDARHRFMDTIWEASETLHDAAYALQIKQAPQHGARREATG